MPWSLHLRFSRLTKKLSESSRRALTTLYVDITGTVRTTTYMSIKSNPVTGVVVHVNRDNPFIALPRLIGIA